jgi:ankyrin repeat protein
MVAALKGHSDTVQCLIAASAKTTLRNNKGETALMLARKERLREIAALLELHNIFAK